MTVENMKTGFVERIGGTIFVVNAMPAENAKHTQEELVKALIAREAMALQEADVANENGAADSLYKAGFHILHGHHLPP